MSQRTGASSADMWANTAKDGTGTDYQPIVDSNGKLMTNMGSLVPEEYDYISLSYTGANLTGVVYKDGGSGGTTVATLTLAYTGAVLDTVTRT